MDSSRDNLFTRFTTFWWALFVFVGFGVLLAVIWLFNNSEPKNLEDVVAEARYKNKEDVLKAQAAALPQETIDKAISTVATQLAASKPAAVSTDAQIVPGSARAKAKEAGGSVDPTAINKAAAESTDPVDPAVVEKGKASYLLCGACHGQNGEGVPMAGPPLAGSEWVTGPVSNLVIIGFRGLTGPITVAGKEHTEFVAGMAPMAAAMTDEDFAAVLTYIRNSFGNKASQVKPEWVKAFRGEIGKPQLPTSELIKPEAK
ncbi:cytochrome c [Luteolibacter sp. SL250]|uniref:c-type cytochrome n=1 Tax=Luteolibacter sp. SL250 TaxID=2995170 RepID=UPI00227073AA|nr:cytochrome c [Luteolibacter sp. SL250]WAC19242.1 cytochrome c [Luteolibacter sp. SL250]